MSTFMSCLKDGTKSSNADIQKFRPKSKQIKLMKRSWEVIHHELERVGVMMFMGVFEEHPEVEKLFHQKVHTQANIERFEDKMRVHGLRFMKLLGEIMRHTDDWSVIDKTLNDLGRRHFTYEIPPNLIDVFGMQFLFAIKPVLNEQYSKDVHLAWESMFHYIEINIKNGIAMAAAENGGGEVVSGDFVGISIEPAPAATPQSSPNLSNVGTPERSLLPANSKSSSKQRIPRFSLRLTENSKSQSNSKESPLSPKHTQSIVGRSTDKGVENGEF